MRRPKASLLIISLLCSSCERPTLQWEPPQGDDWFACHAVICAPGAGDDDNDGNSRLAELCESIPGVVRRCDESGCSPLSRGVDAIEDGLDFIGMTVPDNCTVGVIGYSWGGVDAIDAVRRRPGGSRPGDHVDTLVLIDPFVPFLDALSPPPAARHTLNLRHSIANDDDCSLGMPLAPYRGLPLTCDDERLCEDIDLSVGMVDDPLVGDHCGIIDAVADTVWWGVVPSKQPSTTGGSADEAVPPPFVFGSASEDGSAP